MQDCNAVDEICVGSENIFATVIALDRTTSEVTDWKSSVAFSVWQRVFLMACCEDNWSDDKEQSEPKLFCRHLQDTVQNGFDNVHLARVFPALSKYVHVPLPLQLFGQALLTSAQELEVFRLQTPDTQAESVVQDPPTGVTVAGLLHKAFESPGMPR